MSRRCFQLLALLCLWSARGLVADDRFEINTADTAVEVRLEHGLAPTEDGQPWRNWLQAGLLGASQLTGRFPVERVIVELRSAGAPDEAVVFGQVRRGSPPRIRFYVDPGAEAQELADDWRGDHEFAHLLIPFPGNADIWFTEGFASYYQYLLPARAGRIAPEDAWRRLLAGFERGRSDPRGRGTRLRELSPAMWRERAFRRVYWTGAAFFLRVDTRLRLASNGEHSIDTALAAFHADGLLRSGRRWSAQALIEALGARSLPQIWLEEYRATIDAPAEPRFDRALVALGIERHGESLRFSSAPEQVDLRRAIVGPVQAASSDFVVDRDDLDPAQPAGRGDLDLVVESLAEQRSRQR